SADELVCSVEYASALYKKETVERMASHLLQFIDVVVNNSQVKLSSIEIVTAQEKEQILTAFNDTSLSYPSEKTIHKLFEEQVELTPDQVAVVFEGSKLTYRELNEKANRLARTLKAQGVQAEQLVGLMVERSLEMVIGMFGILKAGGAYVPIDPEYPEERIRYMLNDSGAKVLLTQSHLRERIAFEGKRVVVDEKAAYHEESTNLDTSVGPQDLAYVIYTSGTTGQPKGVLVEHRGLCNLKRFFEHTLHMNERDKVVQFASLSFDASCWETLMALFTGATLYVPTSSVILDYSLFERFMNDNGITTATLPPAYAIYLEPERLPALEKIITAGSSSSAELVRKWKDIKYFNAYGPTEDSICTSIWAASNSLAEQRIVTIGSPIVNHRVYIVDSFNQLQPVGVAGELCIAGTGLARGYLNRADLTAEKFVNNPFETDERMYKTGDLARWLPDGSIEYLGRADHQVKIRGYRIELGEVEARLLDVEHVQEAIVVAREDEAGQKQLCAYFVGERQLTLSHIREALSDKLPGYMIPSYFVQLERMPLTPNGKVDRKALPAPEGSALAGTEYVAPRTAVETHLAKLWQEVLGISSVGVKDNFFDIGGHSLRATQLVSRIHKGMDSSISLREVFESPTIEQMAQMIEGRDQITYAAIPLVEESEHYPASSAQKRLFILSQMEGGEMSYNMPVAMTVEGVLDRTRVEQAFQQLIRRHETLRTSFEMADGEPVQQVHATVPFEVEYVQAKEEEVEAHVGRFVRAFDLGQAPLLRVQLIELDREHHVLLFDMHHIISDGVSMGILIEEFNRLYEGRDLPPLRIQYKDYAVWQQAQIQSERLSKQEAYWLEIFQGELPVLDLPTDYVRPAVRSFVGDRVAFVIDGTRSEALKRFAAQTGSTMYMVLLAAYTSLLHKYTGQEDIIVGTPIAGRPHADLGSMIGMFVNTLAIRNYPSGEKTFQAYLQEVKETALKAYENQDYPFDALVEKLDLKRDLSRNPLFDAMFVLQNAEQGGQTLEGLQFKPHPYSHDVAKFDLTLSVSEEADLFVCNLEYASAIYERNTIERMAQHYLHWIDRIVENSQAQLSSLEIILPEEKEQILNTFNDSFSSYPQEKTIHQLFEEQAERTPEQVAVVFEGNQLTYRELNVKANQLARRLRAEGVQAEQMVGLMVERSLEMIVGMLGILKAGGAYVPIDPEYPEERIRYLLEDSGVQLLLAQRRELVRVDFTGTVVDLSDEGMYDTDGSNLKTAVGASGLSYVIYTSGTSGKPKGVMVEHRNVVRLVKNTNYTPLNETTRILQTGAVVFDASTFEIWGALLNGGQLYLVNNDVILNAANLKRAIEQHGITTLWLTSSLFNQLLQQDSQFLGSLKTLLVGGDTLSVPHINRALQDNPELSIINGYGPTENTTFSTTYAIGGGQTGPIPIGRPIHNSTAYVVDRSLKLQPIGAWGELLVGGDGVARGYLNLPELTAEKFIASPVREDERCYRTGDLVRWRTDGTLEFKSRIDEQVKIRGYRIELGEVEAQLAKVKGVREGAVIAREDEHGQKSLCAYVVLDRELTVSDLRGALSEELPGYMIPSYFVQLEQMPLT
ncbi:amino acid adenylation domain-containing protein, partial [Paenibacillus elgii]|uniref:amino acid adenylation domain-containing protein n=1 Tax=Paenibacillus elgii TaxID=189691 RepID=UPI0030D9A3D2